MSKPGKTEHQNNGGEKETSKQNLKFGANNFSNDGSFLDMFKKLQGTKGGFIDVETYTITVKMYHVVKITSTFF